MMNKNNRPEIFNDIIDTLDIDKIEYSQYQELLKILSSDEKVRLLDRVKEETHESSKINDLILSLPSEIRIKYFEYYDINFLYSAKAFFEEITNEDDIFNALKVKLNKMDDTYAIPDLFSMVPPNKKVEFLRLIAEKEKELQTDIITVFNIAEYLKQFDINQREYVVKNIIFREFPITHGMYNRVARFDSWYYPEIIGAFSDESVIDLSKSKMFEILKFLTEENKKISETNAFNGISNPEKIVKLFYEHGYDPNQIIEFLMNSGTIENGTELDKIISVLPMENRKDTLNFMINLDSSKRKLSEFEFFFLLNQLPLNEATDFFIKYCLVEKKYDYLYPIHIQSKEGHSSLDYLNIVFKNLSPEELTNSFEKIKNAFLQIEQFPKYDEKYNLIVSVFSKKYNVSEQNLLLFAEKFGYNIIKYLENDNIKKFINSNRETIEKLFDLFTKDTTVINKSVTNDILNSLVQRQFMLENRETYNIFSKFENLSQSNDLNGVKKLLEKIFNRFDYSEILQKYNCTMDDLYNQIMSGNLKLLHIITDKYIAYEREAFAEKELPNARELLLMKKVITRDSYKKVMIEKFWPLINKKCQELVNVNFTEEQTYLIKNDDLLRELIMFKNNPNGYALDDEQKKYLKVLNELLNIMYDNKVDFNSYRPDSPFGQGLDFELVQDEISNEFLIRILLESNYEGVMNLLSNDANYLSLKGYLEKYKIVGWESIFEKIMAKSDIQFDEGTVASLISNYDKIKPRIDNKVSLTSIIDYANCYGSLTGFYRILFGLEDYNLLAANEGRNKATVTKYERLSGCRDLVPLMYAKKSFTIPTIDESFTLKNGNDIRIVLGNATNMMNLTYGERTDACMRKSGAFDDLFVHCLTDKSGFHIRFVNPKTGNFVSRVSGTRNGNTVFLNELRDSVDAEYSNEDLYEAIKIMAEQLVQLSKDSEFPIDNIIVTSDYALHGHNDENQSLNLLPEEKASALRGITFNFSDNGILLANSENSDKIMPYQFSDNLPNYASVRDRVKVYYGKDAVNRMLQIRMINDLVNGVSPENINTTYDGEMPDYVVSGEDYYIAYSKEKIDMFIIDSCKEDSRTLAEINNILNNKTDTLDSSVSKGVSR